MNNSEKNSIDDGKCKNCKNHKSSKNLPQVAPEMAKLTPEELEAGKTPAGGYNRAQLAEWGVSWPPPSGWRMQLTGGVKKPRKPKVIPVVAPELASLTKEELEAGRTPAGGFTRVQLAEWGIEYPPSSGWQKKLLTKKD